MNLVSVVIPARNEAANIRKTVETIAGEFKKHPYELEIVVVNDGSTDATADLVMDMEEEGQSVRLVNNKPPHGFGNAIKKGLEKSKGDYVVITMADLSDKPQDMVRYVREMENGYDCCFGTRWCKAATVRGYPTLKYVLNRMANGFIQILFGLRYNDVTNAFKGYSKATVRGLMPILSHHFNITVELPLKAIVRGYKYTVIPTDWRERRKGVSKLKIPEMGSRYLFIILYVFLEKLLCRRDYQKK